MNAWLAFSIGLSLGGCVGFVVLGMLTMNGFREPAS